MEQVLDAGAAPGLGLKSLVSELQNIAILKQDGATLLQNLMTFVSCELSINTGNNEAQKVYSQLSSLSAKLTSATTSVRVFLDRAPEQIASLYLDHPRTLDEKFSLEQTRAWSENLLSEKEETLIATLNQHGPQAWGNLYSRISGSMICEVATGEKLAGATHPARLKIGLAQATGLLRDADEPTRKAAWEAIQNAWKVQEDSTAAILNGLTGWRLDLHERRSTKRTPAENAPGARGPLHYLDQPLHANRVRRASISAMLEAVESQIEMPRRALSLMAKTINKNQLDAWDLQAPAPAWATNSTPRPYKEGLRMVRDAFAAVDPAFADFVDLMEKNHWIEGRVLASKSQGAYCTRFRKSRSPRVYQTYMGSIADIRTLAHELGHAYHAWVMRDMAATLHGYPMTLAETASIFAETTFADHLLASRHPGERFEIAWQNAHSASTFLLNIPTRFDIESRLFEARKSGFVSAQELGEISETAWRKWYGPTLGTVEKQFWMTKLHFSMSGTSFYNFPYTFGYLFSLSLYALRKERGAEFMPSYVALLRDTGRMTAEELAMKHMGEDITKPEFWLRSIELVSKQVDHFETLCQNLAPQTTSTFSN
jgi:oligoendopeptidase F